MPAAEWIRCDWQQAKVHLHPQLKTLDVNKELLRCITQLNPFEISQQLPIDGRQVVVNSTMAACLLPLWEGPQSVQYLADRWLKLRPLHPVTLEPVTEKKAFDEVKDLLKELEALVYVLLER
ncbi:MAG TPA: hypothetical protein DCP31_15180 [Cyanobacteria bacterium UBA8543]|nr:hypothetical protein [Cyanobacteria bacterium UBA8543]